MPRFDIGKITIPDITFATLGVTIYELPNFGGRSRVLALGTHRLFDLSDMNDTISSFQVPNGLVAMVYEHADSGGGYGISADFMEDCPDLSAFGLDEKISYITVFNAKQPSGRSSLIWVRNSLVNGEFIGGHWERERANGPTPMSPVAVVSPPIPPHDFVQPVLTGAGTPAEPDSATVRNHVIQAFAPFTRTAQLRWDMAVDQQQGIIGSDFRGVEEIGSAAFERASNNLAIPDNLNFWYPQKQPRDHRQVVHFKRTLAGTLLKSRIVEISGTYPDHDLTFHLEPAERYRYLITDGHEREYTDIMSAQWTLSGHQSGQPDCDDPGSIAAFQSVECEIDTDAAAKFHLNSMFNNSIGRQLCAYGPWIFDKGHCCQPEIHPAEQIWWSDPFVGRVYFCNLFCDGSKRFWWRDQMDDGSKLKPWGAPPITGTFAIAFEMEINTVAKQFEIAASKAKNHVTVAEGFQRHHLTYQNNTLISVVQDSANPVKVSFEDVGLVGTSTVRGFLVLEATVGKCTQRQRVIVAGVPVNLPPNSDPNSVPQHIERAAFKKEAGHLMLVISQGDFRVV